MVHAFRVPSHKKGVAPIQLGSSGEGSHPKKSLKTEQGGVPMIDIEKRVPLHLFRTTSFSKCCVCGIERQHRLGLFISAFFQRLFKAEEHR